MVHGFPRTSLMWRFLAPKLAENHTVICADLRLAIWRRWAPHAQGQEMKGGHFFPEENPDDTAVLVKQFLSA